MTISITDNSFDVTSGADRQSVHVLYHLMISYSWSDKEIVYKVKEELCVSFYLKTKRFELLVGQHIFIKEQSLLFPFFQDSMLS